MSRTRHRILSLFAVLFLSFEAELSSGLFGAALPDPSSGYNWREVAKARKLNSKDIQQLDRDKVLLTNEAFPQAFDAYIKSDISTFITSDSVLNGFHVLFEESMLRVERVNARRLREVGAFEPGLATLNTKQYAAEIRSLVALLKATGADKKGGVAWLKDLTSEEKTVFQETRVFLHCIEAKKAEQDNTQYFAEAIEQLGRLAGDIENGKEPRGEQAALMFAELTEGDRVDLGPLWRDLSFLCRRLESLAHKQLRGLSFNDSENQLLADYGTTLAAIMLYSGNSYLTPRDDAPRIVDVFSNPNERAYLEVGIERPRALYVLYPFKGGAVMPYFEFVHAERMTDVEWRQLLATTQRPGIPEWLKPIVGQEGITIPKMKREEE